LTAFCTHFKLGNYGTLLIAGRQARRSALSRSRYSTLGGRHPGVRLGKVHLSGGPLFPGRQRKNYARRNSLSVRGSRQRNSCRAFPAHAHSGPGFQEKILAASTILHGILSNDSVAVFRQHSCSRARIFDSYFRRRG